MTITRLNPMLTFGDRNWSSIFDQSFEGRQQAGSVNIIDRETSIDFEMVLPAISKDAIEIKVEGNRLIILAEKNYTLAEGEKFLRNDFSSYKVRQSYVLPQHLDKEAVKADYEAGVLKISFAKKQDEKPRLIPIS
jgi:HSP20 family protein